MAASINRLVRPRRPVWLRIIIWLLVFIFIVLAFATALGAYFVMRAQPTTNGSARLAGLGANVSVVRDNFGIPHITASTEEDLWMAMGYVHAQDRLFQMELFRRAASGRLSEFAGTATQLDDEIMRAVGLRRTAQLEYASLSADQRKPLDDYAKGVNAFIDTHKDVLPVEFLILGFSPEPWTPVDTLAIGRQIPWSLSGNWNEELMNCDLAAKLGPVKARELIPDAPASVTGTVQITPTTGSTINQTNVSTPSLVACGRASGSLATFDLAAAANPFLRHDSWVGSNDWVIDGSKSATGKPMLANDPHLGLRNPNIWYEIHLSTSDGKFDVAGFSFAGVPGVVVGHNQNIAWGVTNVGPDVQDLFLEKLDPANHPGQYLYKGQWQAYQVITETIKVKGETDDVLPVRITVHGPLITDAMTDTETSTLQPMALDWVGNQKEGLISAVLNLDHAQNWTDFRAALKNWAQAGQNFVYADQQGNIGYQATGNVPIRPKGDDGLLPVDGSSGAHDWQGYVPFDALPMLYNPPTHYVATANFRPYGSDYQYFLGARFETPWRITRIREMIAAKDKLTQADMEAMQHDQHSVLARAIGAKLANLHSSDPLVQQAIDGFKNWDGSMAGNSSTAAIYELTYLQMLQLTFKDDLGEKLFNEYIDNGGSYAGLWIYENLDNPTASWWDNVNTAQKETRDDIMLQSIANAVTDLKGRFGGSLSDWQWNKLHTITFAHPLGSVKPLNLIFNQGPYPVGGDNSTVNVSPFSLRDAMQKNTYDQDWVPSYRAVYDLTDWNKTQIVMPMGEASTTGTSHVNDQTPLWLSNGYLNFAYSQAAIDAVKDGTLTLTP